jgi:hypothetical protein
MDPTLLYCTAVTGVELDRLRIEKLLRRAADTLEGDWLLVGGAAAALWFSPQRTTQDIDLIKDELSNVDRLRLLEVAEAEGLPFEAVNSAADFRIRRIPDWTLHAVLLHAGASARIFRPSATVFLLSKISRLGEQDLDDCLALLDWCAAHGEDVDRTRVTTALVALPATSDDALAARRTQLAGVLAS